MILFALCLAFATAACTPASSDTILADLYYRYDPAAGGYTVELELARTNGADSLVTSYLPEGGVTVLGNSLDNDMSEASYNRFRKEIKADFEAGAPVTFQGLSAKPITIAFTLPRQDSIAIGTNPTRNFGLTAYSLDTADRLSENENMAALFQANDGKSYLAELRGPTKTPQIFQFARETVSAWPMGNGKITFIRRRTTPLNIEGVKGSLTEEVYSRPQNTGVFN